MAQSRPNFILSYSIHSFNEMSNELLYAVLKLRTDVFVVEQECAYAELDDKDQRALHVIGVNADKEMVGYTRIVQPTDANPPSLGRIVVAESHRGKGLGHEMMRYCLEHLQATYGSKHSQLSAQSHLAKFYEDHGYKVVSEEYVWDGIPHVDMIL